MWVGVYSGKFPFGMCDGIPIFSCLAEQACNKFQGLRMPYLLLKYCGDEWSKSIDQSQLELELRHFKSIVRRIDDGLKRLLEQHL